VIQRAEIVAIGDSQTYGRGATLEASWPHQLEMKTGQTVYNMAWGGWGPVEYAFIVEEARQLSPKLVVIGLYTADIADAFLAVYLRGRRPEWRQPLPEDPLRGLVDAGFLADQEARRRSILEVFPRAARSEPPDLAYREPPFVPLDAVAPPSPSTGGHALRLMDASAYMQRWLTYHWRPYYRWRQQLAGSPSGPLRRRLGTSAKADKGTSQPVDAVASALSPRWMRRSLQVEARMPSVDFRSPIATEGFGITVAALEEIRDRLRGDGTRLLVLLIPTRELVLLPLLRDAQGPALDEVYAEYCRWEEAARECLRAALEARRVEVADPLPALRASMARGRIPYPLKGDGHPNVLGYGLLAKAVREAMEHESDPKPQPVDWPKLAAVWGEGANEAEGESDPLLDAWAILVESTPPVLPESIHPYDNALSTHRYRWDTPGASSTADESVVVAKWAVWDHTQAPIPVLGERVHLRLEPLAEHPDLLTQPMVDGLADLAAEIYVPVDLPHPP
jgi:lysophospholipase L1-like esterase